MQQDMLPEDLRRIVGEKLHEALVPLMAPSIRHVAAINTIGCYLLCHLTDNEYEVVAGSLTVRQGGAPLGLEADASRVDDDQYYLWIERRQDDGRVDRTCEPSRAQEVVKLQQPPLIRNQEARLTPCRPMGNERGTC